MRLSLPLLLIALLSGSTAFGFARFRCQRANQPDPARGSIAGTVTIGGKPAPHITVVLILDNHDVPVVDRTVTDEAGHFKFASTSSGRYLIKAIAPTSTPTETANPDSEGKPVSLKDGEELQGIDLPLVRGGVITGRVTDSDGLPITGEEISLCQIADDGSKRQCYQYDRPEFTTDDRGLYRIYGLTPGRYTASAGKARAEMGGIDHQGRGNYVRTFYPSTTDESQASAIEVTSGGESTGIDS